jgi:hypothetical protein
LGYNLSKIVDLQVSIETFHQRFGNELKYSQLRFGGELDFKISKQIKVAAFYLHEKELTEFIFVRTYGVKLGFNL